jgi:hypothetical protein
MFCFLKAAMGQQKQLKTRKKEEIPMGTASMTTRQFREFAEAVLRSLPDDLDTTTAQRWIENQENLRTVLRKALMPGKPMGNTYSIFVDYERSVEDGIEAGLYTWDPRDIASKNFPTTKIGKAEITLELIQFNRVLSTNEALTELNLMGYRPAELRELLALGEQYPEAQREFSIFAFGSILRRKDGSCYVPFLYSHRSGRGIALYNIPNWDLPWWGEPYSSRRVRLAAVRKQ